MDLSALWYVLAALLILAGLAGVVLPALPGLPLMFGGMLLAAWAGGFERIGALALAALGALTLLSVAVDLLATALGARRVGAGPLAVWGAALGTLAGLGFRPLGLLLGPFVGALAGELWHSRALLRAAHVGLATWLGLLLGTVLKLALAFAMLGLFILAWFF
ncbi:hypothetical protein B1992_01340 [Pseudoxanthomonas broegbernensis]|uniref:DUF456 domain-containing protein n=1 Tax=Pseudoxanthomonas broegbernensis TaxID=83619 RepID=A0A7V8GQC5_9GAMM|nr:DUF456 domain-containing protein [Pseudoxanthomonas broegbernensis]KAF1688096.1 hypothetical protein B1992_01340 [Pseudoxanthomonas broegbernensis]MBB6065134.1 hypothetical protein [Pseudoxanthomonas broegbernensis]